MELVFEFLGETIKFLRAVYYINGAKRYVIFKKYNSTAGTEVPNKLNLYWCSRCDHYLYRLTLALKQASFRSG